MPGYSPLPRVELDPRNESELVQAAARRVYEASNSTLNDFSSGSPVVALLEGQAFAQAEFLQFANQFPESVLIEWIGPFLGAQRRTGAGAIVDITFTIDPRDDQFDIFSGYRVATDSNLTDGESVVFVTTERLIIPAGQSSGTVSAVSVFRGTGANVAPDTIIKSITSLAGIISLTNAQAAAGGQDPELLSEVKERFFSLIRRRNPVSAEDWVDFFSDALGPGTSVSVLPRRSERGVYEYGDNYVQSNPSVAFFVLNPDGSPITSAQQAALQNLIKWSLPTEFLGYVYPMEVDDVDFVMDLKYDSTKPYAQNLNRLTEIVRNNLFSVMTPNAVFPLQYSQSVTDVEGALTSTFPLTLGVTNQYLDPDVTTLKAYYPPESISVSSFTGLSPKPFDSGNSIKADDLVIEQGNTTIAYYQALQDFTPSVNDKPFYVNTNNLNLSLIRELEAGSYAAGDVISVGDVGALHVALTPFVYRAVLTVAELISKGYISEEKLYTAWTAGFFTSTDDNGNYNPNIIQFVQGDVSYVTGFPATPTSLDVSRRPGTPVYVVSNDFTVTDNTTTLGTAQQEGLVATSTSQVKILTVGEVYTTGDYVKTPAPAELQAGQIATNTCYLDLQTGVSEIYARVVNGFTFTLTSNNYKEAVDALVEDNAVAVVDVIPFVNCQGESTFALKPFRYQARFGVGEYVRYRPEGGFNASFLEDCVVQSDTCAEISGPCKKLLKLNLPLPSYYFVLKDFTPNTAVVSDLVADGFIEEINGTSFLSTYTVTIPTSATVYPSTITTTLITTGIIKSSTDLVNGSTALVIDEAGVSRGLYEWNNSSWIYLAPSLPKFRDLFRFAPGDVASFRSVSEIRNYQATAHVTPVLDINVYYDNGTFVKVDLSENTKWIDPTYRLEDVIFNDINGAMSFYRSIRSFTPPTTRTVWNSTVIQSSPRSEEIIGNTLKFVKLANSADNITSRLRDFASTTKLGTCQINLTSKSIGSVSNSFVWESTIYSGQTPALSYYPTTDYPYGPVDYGTGTLAL